MALKHAGAAVMMRSARALVALVLVVAAAACSSGVKPPPTGTPEPDKFLFDRGTEALNAKRWYVAREYFRRLVDGYPQSRFRADAKLGVGDTYLGERSPESYVLAANEYREFLSYYPTHLRAGYAQYKLGLTYYSQMRSAERDQTETRDAIRELGIFVDRYPNDPLIADGRQKLAEAKDRLSQAAYRVGYFYWRARWYPGAVDRFREIMQDNPQYGGRDAVYFHLADALEHSQRPAEALPYYERLIAEFEQSEYLAEAQRRADGLKTQIGTAPAPKADDAAPKAGEPAPKAGDQAPKAGEPSPKAGDQAPKAGEPSPKAGDQTPKAGAAPKPPKTSAASPKA